MREKDLQQLVVDLARLNGWLAFHAYDSRRSEPGFPDLTMARGDRLLFVELKGAKGRLSAPQRLWLERLRATGCEVYVVRPADWEAVEAVLARRPEQSLRSAAALIALRARLDDELGRAA